MRKTRTYQQGAVYTLTCTELMQKLRLDDSQFIGLAYDIENDLINIMVEYENNKPKKQMQYL